MRIRFKSALAACVCVALSSQFTPPEAVFAASGTPSMRSHATTIAVGIPPKPIPVKEPLRIHPKTRPANAIRPAIARFVPAPPGRTVSGPPMFSPRQIDAILTRSHHAATDSRPRVQTEIARPQGSIGRAGPRRSLSLPSNPSGSGTGMNPWWRYQQETIPGVQAMVNVGTGNLVVQDEDMSVSHKGIALAFRRSYNSQSQHDVSGTDGAPLGMYGNGWTNTFDAHLSGSLSGGITVWDIDGARYDYSYVDGTNWAPPPGQHATLTWDAGCGMLWTKKSGTSYYFWVPSAPGGTICPSWWWAGYGAYGGRLYQLIGRNRNTYMTFTYSWDNGNSSPGVGKISGITGTTESGQAASMSFADVNGHRLLQQLTFPDGTTTVRYAYDSLGNLTSVTKPANNSAGTTPQVWYGYNTIGTDNIMAWTTSPRWAAACNVDNCGGDGAYLAFAYNGSTGPQSTVSSLQIFALVNPSISDGYSSGPIQSGYPNYAYAYHTNYYTTGVTTPTFRDTDGHSINWVVDGLGRPTQTQECTSTTNQGQQCTGTLLTSTETWDSNDNLTAEVDPRGNETDYSYDADGNAVAIAAPTTTTTAGTFRPTKLFDYDSHGNIVAYCDEKASNPRGNWTSSGPPTAGAPDGLCAANGAAAHATYTYATPAPEPYGEQTTVRSALGYTNTIHFDTSPQGGSDYGQPTSVVGDQIAQSDGLRTPQDARTYDATGNLICYMADANDATTTTVVTYDALNRVTGIADPDDASVTNASCTKTPGIAGSAIVKRTTYYPNGQVATTQTPAEAAAGVSTQFTYDLDGNVTSEQQHYTNTAGPTTKWYDAMGRLVEVQQPTDPSDFYTFSWTTRYLYDLTQGGTVTVGSSSPYHAYGGLFKTQELLPSGSTQAQWNETGSLAGGSVGTGSPTWQDTTGTAFDALDRSVAGYRNTGTALITDTKSYDGTNSRGLLAQQCNGNNECASFTYDARNAKVRTDFSVTSSTAQVFTYDEAGRLAGASNGVGSVTDAYDADGRKTTRQEIVGNVSASIAYAYYADGLRKSLDVSTSSQSLPSVLAYTYRNDQALRRITVAGSQWFTFGYTGGRRLTTRSDSTGQGALSLTYTGGGSPTSYGLVQAISAPAFNESGMTYNAEGAQLTAASFNQWNGSGWYPGSPMINNAYTARGELLQSDSTQRTLYANGMRIQASISTGTPHTGMFAFNVLQSRVAATDSGNTCNTNNGLCDSTDSAWQYGYDAGGRQTSAALTSASNEYTNTKSYDAENHLVDAPTWLPVHGGAHMQQLGYQWGAIGHPLQVGSTSVGVGTNVPTDFQYDVLGWDDDVALFTINPSGSIDDVKIGDFADYVPGASNSLTVWDRDVAGQIYSCHNAGGIAKATSYAFQSSPGACLWNGFNTVSYVPASVTGTLNKAVGHGGMLIIPKNDGFSDGVNTIQGTRAFDPQAGTWTTPDAYRGSVHDPMTQKPYVWNRNNPVSYSDPSGYYWAYIDPQLTKTIERLMKSKTFAERYKAIAADKHPFSMYARNEDAFSKDKTLDGYTIFHLNPYMRLIGRKVLESVDIYIRPDLKSRGKAETVAHEAAGHGYQAIADPDFELNVDPKQKYEDRPQEQDAYGVEDLIMRELDAVEGKRTAETFRDLISGELDESFTQITNSIR